MNQSPIQEATGSEGGGPYRALYVSGKELSRKAGFAGSVTFASNCEVPSWLRRNQREGPKACSVLDGSLITGTQGLCICKMGIPHNSHCNKGWFLFFDRPSVLGQSLGGSVSI